MPIVFVYWIVTTDFDHGSSSGYNGKKNDDPYSKLVVRFYYLIHKYFQHYINLLKICNIYTHIH